MKLHKYLTASGEFDYEKYRRVQEEGNIRKLDKIWAREEIVQNLAKFLKSNMSDIKFGLCHGTRRGLEQLWFSKHTGAKFLGTEISSTATQFRDTIQWDFHQVKDEWVGTVDVIYSNSWDHSYNPHLCFQAWMSCLRPGGFMLLEHTDNHKEAEANELDPFGIGLDELTLMLTEIGGGDCNVAGILRDVTQNPGRQKINLSVVVVQRRETPLQLKAWL